jgi:hypothetical protein
MGTAVPQKQPPKRPSKPCLKETQSALRLQAALNLPVIIFIMIMNVSISCVKSPSGDSHYGAYVPSCATMNKSGSAGELKCGSGIYFASQAIFFEHNTLKMFAFNVSF